MTNLEPSGAAAMTMSEAMQSPSAAPAERETRHTPGPWTLCAHMSGRADGCPCGFYGNVWGGSGEAVVAFMGLCHPHDTTDERDAGCTMLRVVDDLDERKANARLIAAAPDLLAACKAALTDLCFVAGETADDQPTIRLLEDAIARAEAPR